MADVYEAMVLTKLIDAAVAEPSPSDMLRQVAEYFLTAIGRGQPSRVCEHVYEIGRVAPLIDRAQDCVWLLRGSLQRKFWRLPLCDAFGSVFQQCEVVVDDIVASSASGSLPPGLAQVAEIGLGLLAFLGGNTPVVRSHARLSVDPSGSGGHLLNSDDMSAIKYFSHSTLSICTSSWNSVRIMEEVLKNIPVSP